MGITSRTHLHAHTQMHQLFIFFSLPPSAVWWRKVNGCNREEEDPAETHMQLASSPPTPPCLPFFHPLAYIQTSWHTLRLWGGMMLSHSCSVFPAHQGSHRTHGPTTLIVLFISPHNKRPDMNIWDIYIYVYIQRAVPSENYPNLKLWVIYWDVCLDGDAILGHRC